MADDNHLERAQTGSRGEIDHRSRLGDQFIASLNHDIRTPLSGIVGMTDLLLETTLDEEQREYVNTTKLCADQLLEMLNSALEYAMLSSGGVQLEQAEFHLPKMIELLLEEYRPKAESKQLRIRSRLGKKVPEYVVGDEVRLRQAISPILANAVKFTAKGEIEVSAAMAGHDTDGATKLVLAVRDTGIGIAPDKLDVIFESFLQLESGLSRSYAGMGLGLAVTRKLVSMMGGTLVVDSDSGVGSTFSINVPIRVPAAASPPVDEVVAMADDNEPRILLVDDNDVARRIVTHILRRAAHRIDCAEGGREGIEAARNTRYDVILMDLQMPVVNGLEATAAIRKIPGYEQTPILALTANYSDEFMRRCKESGLQGFLSKPIQRGELLAAIESHLPQRVNKD